MINTCCRRSLSTMYVVSNAGNFALQSLKNHRNCVFLYDSSDSGAIITATLDAYLTPLQDDIERQHFLVRFCLLRNMNTLFLDHINNYVTMYHEAQDNVPVICNKY